jgi:hypothetical protein
MNGSNIPPRDQFALGIKAFNDIIVGKYYIIETPAPTLTQYVGKVIEKTDDRLRVLYDDDDYQETLLREQINGGTIYPTRYTFYAPYPRPTGGTRQRRRRQQRRRKSRRVYRK